MKKIFMVVLAMVIAIVGVVVAVRAEEKPVIPVLMYFFAKNEDPSPILAKSNYFLLANASEKESVCVPKEYPKPGKEESTYFLKPFLSKNCSKSSYVGEKQKVVYRNPKDGFFYRSGYTIKLSMENDMTAYFIFAEVESQPIVVEVDETGQIPVVSLEMNSNSGMKPVDDLTVVSTAPEDFKGNPWACISFPETLGNPYGIVIDDGYKVNTRKECGKVMNKDGVFWDNGDLKVDIITKKKHRIQRVPICLLTGISASETVFNKIISDHCLAQASKK